MTKALRVPEFLGHILKSIERIGHLAGSFAIPRNIKWRIRHCRRRTRYQGTLEPPLTN